MTRAEVRAVTDGRFLCVRVTNLGAPATFWGIVQPGRGTASAAVIRTALWHDSSDAERRLDTGESAVLRIAQRDRPAGDDEVDDRGHPEGSQSWRMWFLKKGAGPAVERLCPVAKHDGPSADDGVVLTVMSGRHPVVKSIELDGLLATDLDTQEQLTVLDSPRHYHRSSRG